MPNNPDMFLDFLRTQIDGKPQDAFVTLSSRGTAYLLEIAGQDPDPDVTAANNDARFSFPVSGIKYLMAQAEGKLPEARRATFRVIRGGAEERTAQTAGGPAIRC